MNLEYFGSGARFHHIGVAVRAIEDVCPTCRPPDALQGVKVAFVSLNGCDLELIEPAKDDSPYLPASRKGNQLLHICYEVDDLEAALRKYRQYGFHLVRQPAQAAAFCSPTCTSLCSIAPFGVVELLETERNK